MKKRVAGCKWQRRWTQCLFLFLMGILCGSILFGTGRITAWASETHEHELETEIEPASMSSDGYICTYCTEGDYSVKETIYQIETVSLSYTEAVYTGKELKPAVTVKDRKGNTISSENYTVTYDDNINPGFATVYVEFDNDMYYDETELEFVIKPKAPEISKFSSTTYNSTKVTWKASTGADGYQVQYSTSKDFSSKKTKTVTDATSLKLTGLTIKTTYYVRVRAYVEYTDYCSEWSTTEKVKTSLPAPSISKFSSTKVFSTEVTWKKSSGAKGYQVQYSTKKSFASKKTETVTSGTSLTLTGLKAKTKYYVRVRAYVTVSGKKYYSSWSTAKIVTTKKAVTTTKTKTFTLKKSDSKYNRFAWFYAKTSSAAQVTVTVKSMDGEKLNAKVYFSSVNYDDTTMQDNGIDYKKTIKAKNYSKTFTLTEGTTGWDLTIWNNKSSQKMKVTVKVVSGSSKTIHFYLKEAADIIA